VLALLVQAIVLAVIGMGVVFLSLILLMWTMQLLTWLYREAPQVSVGAPRPAAPAQEGAGVEVVLAAAAAHFIETEGPSLYIPSVTRRSTRWAARGRASSPLRRPR